MGVGLCKEKAPEPNKRALAKQRYSKTKVSGLSQLPPPSVHESENRSKPGMSVVSRKSDLSMYYSCIPNENSLAMNNTWLENPDYEEYKEKDGSSSEDLKVSGHFHPQKVHEVHSHEQVRKKSNFANQETNHTTNETMHTREEMYASNKLQSITDRADSEEESPRSRFQTMSEGFFEPNSFLDEDLDKLDSKQKRISIAQKTFSFGVIADEPGLDPVEEERKKRIKGIQETFGFMEFVFSQGLDGYKKIYESKDSFNKLEVKLKTVKTHKGIKVVCVHSEWFVAGSGEALVRFINSAKGMNEVLQHIGSFEEYEKITDEKGHKYTVYGMSYEVGLNTQVKGPVFIRSYKAIGEGKWRDAFRVIDGPSLIGLDGFVGTNISVGGHMITKLAGEEGKYKVKLYFETVLPEEDAELISVNLLAEKVQVYVNGFNAAAIN